MSSTFQIFAASCALSILADWSVPEYSPGRLIGVLFTFPILGCVWVVWNGLVYPRFFSPFRGLPSPPGGHILFGHTSYITRATTGDPAKEWIDTVPNDGLIKYSVLFKERLLVTKPAILNELLVTKNYQFIKTQQMRKGLGRVLGIGVLLAEGEEHKIQRRNLTPAFSYRHIKDIYPIFWEKATELVECLSSQLNASGKAERVDATTTQQPQDSSPKHEPGAIEVGEWASRATLDIIGLSAIGRDFNSLQDPSNQLCRTYQKIFSMRNGQIWQILGTIFPFWLMSRIPTKFNDEINGATAFIRRACRDMVTERRASAKERGMRSEVDILSVAIESGGFKDEELVDQMMTFLAAGHETTSSAMTGAMYLLCKHPDVQQKLRDEIRAKIPAPGENITPSDIDDCHYLQAVCWEALRVWAPVSLTSRVAVDDSTLNGQFVPKDTPIILCPSAVNVSTHLWGDNARQFVPERWLDSTGRAGQQNPAASRLSFLSFLHGPRSCIGQRFAEAELACLLAAWVGRYETRFESGSPHAKGELEIRPGLTTKPKGGLWCVLREVPGW